MKRTVLLGLLAVVIAAVATCSGEESVVGAGNAGVGAGTGTGTQGGGSTFVPTGGNGTGGCGASCSVEEYGVGTDHPFDPGSHDSEGVGTDPDGALVLDQSATGIPSIIWVANTNMGTVTKVDTTTYEILGRYRIGPDGATADPSRTSVNSLGDVFVGNRAGNHLTKISSAGVDCPDTNNDGQITTSTGFGDVLAWGQDDCVFWREPVPNSPHVRGVAAQDVEVADPIPDDPHHTLIEHYVWTGGTAQLTAYKFDGETGALLFATPAPTAIYGLALDGMGQLWMSGNGDPNGPVFGRIDTTKCVDQATCDEAEICTSTCYADGHCTCDACSGSCDEAVKERIRVTHGVYGITVDYKQRVWLGGTNVKRYNPLAPADQRYAVLTTSFVHGIAADADGWVWGATGSGVVRIEGDTMASAMINNVASKGMAVDKDGKIWSISYYEGANVIVPGPTIDDYTPQVPAGGNGALGQPLCGALCYTYSDMTGQQLALAANDPGYYREVFEPCLEGDTFWLNLFWEVETPTNTYVSFHGRSAATEADLASANWITLAHVPDDVSPVNLVAAFGPTPLQRYLEVEVRLKGFVGLDGLVSPRVLSFGATHQCASLAQ